MPTTVAASAKALWQDKFRTPTVDALIQGLNQQHARVFEGARSRLCVLAGHVEELVWMGIPWCWCLAYRAGEDAPRPTAFLVPEPGRPILSLPFAGNALAKVPLKTLSKAQRETLVNGTRVGEVLWTVWELQSKAVLDEAFGLLTLLQSAT
ncbi:MAG: hypothetical protein KF866_05475 [Phycisphaeraceae bacterium]|nr:hypothetical protein [Phycisphaeraceae bacterium]